MRTRTQLNSFHTPIVAEKHGKFIFLIADFLRIQVCYCFLRGPQIIIFCFLAVKHSKLTADLPVQKHFHNRLPSRIFCYILQFDALMVFIAFHIRRFLLRRLTTCWSSGTFFFEFQPGVHIVFEQTHASILRGTMPNFVVLEDLIAFLHRFL